MRVPAAGRSCSKKEPLFEIVSWKIWNEPNTMTFGGRHGTENFPGYAAQYTALVKALVSAMCQADPERLITVTEAACDCQPGAY